MNKRKGFVLLSDGTVFHGRAIGRSNTATGEICFNTGMTGYQEIFSDPSYKGQIMVTTNAHIGNYGVQDSDLESTSAKIAGLVCKNFSLHHSRPSATDTLENFMNKHDLLVISDIDTRALVRYIRDKGAQNAIISTEYERIPELKRHFADIPSMEGQELASTVSIIEPYYIGNENAPLKVAALDLGIKSNILRNLADRGVYIKVFPYNTPYSELQKFQPDGYFLSNGPGDPAPLSEAINTTGQIIEDGRPLFGICLGHQVIAQAMGVDTYKMHTGHRGINHPVINHTTGKGEMTSQNHGFAIDREQAEAHEQIQITHTHLNDETVAGMRIKDKPVFSVQYHPEAGPGPNDATYLFDEFINQMNQHKSK